MDKLTREQRSAVMSRIKAGDTTPELRVRHALHSMGYRFRLHRKDLPGKPDIVLPRHRLCLFVHGCFWHQHQGCKRSNVPESNREFWIEKFEKNRMRDESNVIALEEAGWRVCVIWECQTKDADALDTIIRECLSVEANK
ncbi:very short patch repair endonuclease [Chromobacterium sp. ATCC 53434]|uniref:very short patch repair endonuclease n=1 Tax=Chromobacterium sp. (strain ATCC 53434 / SC 14030) TaxID=2059672 RepID=UPI000C7706E3|nr:very short patch repair endonuclease [Chromobacterium sp. ATCC 53434]